jgi:hypothetical protein
VGFVITGCRETGDYIVSQSFGGLYKTIGNKRAGLKEGRKQKADWGIFSTEIWVSAK